MCVCVCLCSLWRQRAAVMDQSATSVCQTSLGQQCKGKTQTHTHTYIDDNRVVNTTLVQALGVCCSGREVNGNPWHFPGDSCLLVCLFRNVTVSVSYLSKLRSGSGVQQFASLCTEAGPLPGANPLQNLEKSMPCFFFHCLKLPVFSMKSWTDTHQLF